MGILNGEDFQVVYSDTPGIIKPEYELHRCMMKLVSSSLEDADIIIFMSELNQKINEDNLKSLLDKSTAKLIFLLNKIDRGGKDEALESLNLWTKAWKFDAAFTISALKGTNVDKVFRKIIDLLPFHPPYYPKDQITDKPERFFAAEILREKIFLNFKKEIPYATEVAVTSFLEDETIIRIRAEIYVERQSQKGILIGKGGEALKKIGIMARKDLETFFGKQVFLEQYVRVEKDWRKRKNSLAKFGY